MRTRSSGLAGELWYRGAVGLLGGLIGLLFAFVVALPLAYWGVLFVPLATATLAGAAAGAVVGMLVPETIFYGMQATAYFIFGLFAVLFAQGGVGPEPASGTPKWLWAAFIFGAAYLLVLAVL